MSNDIQRPERSLKRLVRLWWEASLAYREAVRLAQVMQRRSYARTAPAWKPLDTTAGVISQIDNIHAGILNRCDQYRAQIDRLQNTIQSYQQGSAEKPNEPTLIGNCPKCGEFQGHGHECKPNNGDQR